MTWEYKIVYTGLETVREEEYEWRLHESNRLLNSLGSEGWELVGFLPHRMAAGLTKFHGVFKRPQGG
jgi:hypothetical protein